MVYQPPTPFTPTPQPQPFFQSSIPPQQTQPQNLQKLGEPSVVEATSDVYKNEYTLDTSDSIRNARIAMNKARKERMKAKKCDSFWGRWVVTSWRVKGKRKDREHCFKCNIAAKVDQPLKGYYCWDCSDMIEKAEEKEEFMVKLHKDAKMRKVGIYDTLWEVMDLMKRVPFSELYDPAKALRALEDWGQAYNFQMQHHQQQELNK